ncbi:unnamed protein product [Cercopithifilaria johnstoni]|uniref:Tudor domain-containing protein n=1 Tax=Cercopithifilaria johnstoni TaxID=2874296 RepID=A0A8J2M0F2_9BILA|nr:unnamed protein product [Cercopithifilaria johnstoni]
MVLQHNFYQLKLGLPDTAKSEIVQGQFGKLVIPAATNDYLDAVVTYVESWTTIHVQLPNAYHILSKLQKQLEQIYHTTKSLSNPLSGSVGIIKYEQQNEYYRILIMKRIDQTLILVRFVDFGYTDVATKHLIHPISKRLTNLPAQAFPIRIELRNSIAGSMSLNAFRKYLTNAQVIIQLDKDDKEISGARRRNEKRRKEMRHSDFVYKNNKYSRAEQQSLNEAQEMKSNRNQIGNQIRPAFINQKNNTEMKINYIDHHPISLKDNNKSNRLRNQTPSDTTNSNSWKNTEKQESVETISDRQIIQDLSSLIGLMAYGSLKNDIDKKRKRSDSRKHAGRSIIDFNIPSSLSSSSSSTYVDNTQRRSQMVVKNHANNMDSSSFSETEIQACSKISTSESTNDDDHSSDSSVSSSRTTLNDISNRKQNMKPENCKKDRKNDMVIKIDTIVDNDESSADVSSSNAITSTKSDTTSDGTTTSMAANKITRYSDDESESRIGNNSSTGRRLTHAWTRSNTMPNDNESMNDDYDCTQRNSTLQQNSVSQTFSTHQSNSVSRMFPEHQLDSISRTFPICHTLSSSSSTKTINSYSSENIGQNKYPYANSIHSSDFEIPPYLNIVPTSSYSQQFAYGTPKIMTHAQLTDDIRRWPPSESERTNSIQTHTSNNKIYSESTGSSRILSNNTQIHGNNHRIHLESTRGTGISPTRKLENIPRRFSQEISVEKLTSESCSGTQERRQNCYQSRRRASVDSTIPLTIQKSTISEESKRCSTDFESSLPYKFAKNQKIREFFTNFEQSIGSYPRTDVQLSHPELSEITSVSSEFSTTPNCQNLRKELKLSHAEIQMEQSSLAEEELEMKMNIVLMPKHIMIEKH